MSVPFSKCGQNDLEVLTKVDALAQYTIKICSNEKHFPKRYRWCITSKIVENVVDLMNYTNEANTVFVSQQTDYDLRRRYQRAALSKTGSLLGMIKVAYKTFGIESKRIGYWTHLVIDVRRLLRAWISSDEERYKKYLK